MSAWKVIRLTGCAVAAIGLLCGCGESCESGFTREPSRAAIVNDLPRPVQLRLCDANDCTSFYSQGGTVAPRDSRRVNVSSGGVPNVYLVASPDGRIRYGCLPLVTPRLRPPLAVFVSEHVPCRKDVDEDEYWPARWERAGEPGG